MKHILTLVLVATLSLLLQAPSFGQNPNTQKADQKLEKAVLKGKRASKAKSTDQKGQKAEAKERIDKSTKKIEKTADRAKRQTEKKAGKAADEVKQGGEVRDRIKEVNEKATKVKKDKSANGREMSEDRVKDKVGKSHSHEAGDDHDHGSDSGTHGKSTEKAAKGREKAAKVKANKDSKADREGNDKDSDEAVKDSKGKGNAYGKDKGELSGKAFGAARAADAKQAKVVRKAELEKTITKNNGKATEAREKVKLAKAKLESDKKAGLLNDADYATKKAKIEAVEDGIENLEKDIENAKALKSKVD